MNLLGIDLGSSFVKASVIDAKTGKCLSAVSCPDQEMIISSPKPGWAEQDPQVWWNTTVMAVRKALAAAPGAAAGIEAIGISYQMHGLVVLDKNGNVLRPAIIWCDGRAVDIGNKAFAQIGPDVCLSTMLNSPANFTASKMKWVIDNEPGVFNRAASLCLPGDYIGYKLTGRLATTVSGLSEGILWDFPNHKPAQKVLQTFGIPESMLPERVSTFGDQGRLTADAASQLGLKQGIALCYRAGDQPNNAFSLGVLEPGQAAATAGTSGVVYGVTEAVKTDPASRVNTFAHVNHSAENRRLGVLLCVNGTGIANAWTKRLMDASMSYDAMNSLAEKSPIGSDGLVFLPMGNGAERMIGNRDIGAQLIGLRFNGHNRAHVIRAVQEGIAFSLVYGVSIMKSIGAEVRALRAGCANMFLSPIFRNAIASTLQAPIALYNTDGAQGAARGAGKGAGIFSDWKSAFTGLNCVQTIEPDAASVEAYDQAYRRWTTALEKNL
ncbi:MAG TPA: FGGY family carbohydrate kinase [Chitinivibrionales bacterium]